MIHTFKSEENGQYYFHVKAKNGKIVAQSEGYKSKASLRKGIEALKKAVLAYDSGPSKF